MANSLISYFSLELFMVGKSVKESIVIQSSEVSNHMQIILSLKKCANVHRAVVTEVKITTVYSHLIHKGQKLSLDFTVF